MLQTPNLMMRLVFGALSLTTVLSPSNAYCELLFTFSPTPDMQGTKLFVSGTTDVRGLVRNSNNGIPQVTASKQTGAQQFLVNTERGEGWIVGDSVTLFEGTDFDHRNVGLVADTASGDSIGLGSFLGDRLNRTALIVPNGFESGSLSTQATFVGLPLTTLAPREQLIKWGPSDDQQLRIRVVPEPAALAITSPAAVLLLARRKNARPK